MVTPSRAKFWSLLVAFASITGLAVGFAAGPPDTAVADVLWLPPSARLEEDGARPVRIHNGRSIYVDGTAAVVFSIDSDQDELSRLFIEHFATTGWRPRRTQFLNPHLATSFERGWQNHGGGLWLNRPDTSKRPEPYRRWEGEWDDELGNLLTYNLGGQGRRLRGYASYIPRAVRAQIRREIQWHTPQAAPLQPAPSSPASSPRY